MPDVSRETVGPSPDVVADLFGDNAGRAYRFADLLTGVGVQRGLLGPREAPRIWDRHILNCAVVAPAFAAGATVCDVGSGAGLPGMVLALARPDLQVTLLEPLLRRVAFLDEVVLALELPNVLVRRGRAEELPRGEVFDAVTARAVAPLGVLAGWGLPLVRRGGELVAFKGATAQAEVDEARSVLTRYGAAQVRIATFGHGIVEPATTVIRIESTGKRQR